MTDEVAAVLAEVGIEVEAASWAGGLDALTLT
jgi:hypothetical protein